MNSEIFSNTVRFFFLILLQVLLLNNINFLGYVNPYLYVLFLILFPFNGNQTLFLLLSFLLGLGIDLFEDSGGINAAACLAVGYSIGNQDEENLIICHYHYHRGHLSGPALLPSDH